MLDKCIFLSKTWLIS